MIITGGEQVFSFISLKFKEGTKRQANRGKESNPLGGGGVSANETKLSPWNLKEKKGTVCVTFKGINFGHPKNNT